ncbi:MAG: hypothetical protein IH860_03900 [Chloroflexi bacterium]|nr:hypothetical protein [Chloroflexota bacterium]
MLTARLVQGVDRFFDLTPLRPDRYDGRFLLALGGVLAFTLLAYWSLMDFWDVAWYAGEDGVSEWWTVTAYLIAAITVAVTALLMKRLGHRRIGLVYALLALAFMVVVMEEISWGQRLFDWSTPEALASVNEQGETGIHNITGLDRVFRTAFFLAALLGLVGAGARALLHRHRRVTTADFFLPSLILVPPLVGIVIWIWGGQSYPGNILRALMIDLDIRPVGSEVPEVLSGLALLLYTYDNLKRARGLRGATATYQDDLLSEDPGPRRSLSNLKARHQ